MTTDFARDAVDSEAVRTIGGDLRIDHPAKRFASTLATLVP